MPNNGQGRLPCAIDTVNVQARVDDWQRHSTSRRLNGGLVNAAKMRLSASTDFSVRTYPGTVLGNSKSRSTLIERKTIEAEIFRQPLVRALRSVYLCCNTCQNTLCQHSRVLSIGKLNQSSCIRESTRRKLAQLPQRWQLSLKAIPGYLYES